LNNPTRVVFTLTRRHFSAKWKRTPVASYSTKKVITDGRKKRPPPIKFRRCNRCDVIATVRLERMLTWACLNLRTSVRWRRLVAVLVEAKLAIIMVPRIALGPFLEDLIEAVQVQGVQEGENGIDPAMVAADVAVADVDSLLPIPAFAMIVPMAVAARTTVIGTGTALTITTAEVAVATEAVVEDPLLENGNAVAVAVEIAILAEVEVPLDGVITTTKEEEAAGTIIKVGAVAAVVPQEEQEEEGTIAEATEDPSPIVVMETIAQETADRRTLGIRIVIQERKNLATVKANVAIATEMRLLPPLPWTMRNTVKATATATTRQERRHSTQQLPRINRRAAAWTPRRLPPKRREAMI
jgi:hypothetical protein